MFATTITCTDKTKSASLHQLLTEAVTGFTVGHINPNLSRAVRRLVLQAHPDNGAARIAIGESGGSASDCGLILLAGDSFADWGNNMDNISLIDKCLFFDTDNAVVNVQLDFA